MATAIKETRLQARLSETQKAILEQAAAIRGITLSEFVVSAAQTAAEEVIRDLRVIYLTAEGSRAFAEALLDPPAPNKALRKAFKQYRGDAKK